MAHKREYPSILNWQSVSPITGFLPLNNNTAGRGSVPSGVSIGAMASTNTIYSNILDISLIDNLGLEINWTGTPTGTLSILASNSGIHFYSLTFSSPLTQPAGTASGYLVSTNQLPFKYIMMSYVNVSGTGSLTVYTQAKDI